MVLYRLDQHHGSSFLTTVAALGLSPADVLEMLTSTISPERAQFIALVAKSASDKLLFVEPQGRA